MLKEINLLVEQFEETEAEKKLKRTLNIISPIVLLIFGVIVIGVFTFSLIQSAQASDLNKKIINAQNSIQQHSEAESFLRGSKIKLSAVEKVFQQQVDYSKVIANLQEITPQELTLTNLSLGGDKSVEVSYRAANSDLITTLLNNLLDPQTGGKYFHQVKLKNLVFSKEGNFLISLYFFIKSI